MVHHFNLWGVSGVSSEPNYCRSWIFVRCQCRLSIKANYDYHTMSGQTTQDWVPSIVEMYSITINNRNNDTVGWQNPRKLMPSVNLKNALCNVMPDISSKKTEKCLAKSLMTHELSLHPRPKLQIFAVYCYWSSGAQKMAFRTALRITELLFWRFLSCHAVDTQLDLLVRPSDISV